MGAAKLKTVIRTQAADAVVGRAHSTATKLDAVMIRTQAKEALVGLGWKPAIACAAIDEACAQLSAPTLEILIREALRRCPKPIARTS